MNPKNKILSVLKTAQIRDVEYLGVLIQYYDGLYTLVWNRGDRRNILVRGIKVKAFEKLIEIYKWESTNGRIL